MIGRLRGELIQKLPNLALVDCGGVGYAAAISLSTYGLLPEAGSQVVLHTELLVRENEIALLGFSSTQERELYRLLVKVDGVGPKLALAALGALSLEDLVRAIRGRDVKVLTRIPGVGKKTAQKMALHLKDKLKPTDALARVAAMSDTDGEVLAALTALGYSVIEAQAAIQAIGKDAPDDTEERLRLALQYFQ